MGFEMPINNQENLKLKEAMSKMSEVLGKNEEKIINQFGEASEG